MAVEVWGLLPKSQVDNETIEEAIARLILEHSEDETAHLGAGQSLQSHKASEIIDHLINSVVADKIRDFNVSPYAILDSGFNFRTYFESIDGFSKFKTGDRGDISVLSIGDVAMDCGAQVNDYVALYLTSNFFTINLSTSKPSIEAFLLIGEPSSQDMIIFCANDWARSTDHGFGFIFKASEGKLYAWWKKDGSLYEEEIEGFNSSYENRFRAFLHDGQIDFYLNDDLEYSAVSNIPVYNDEFVAGVAFKAIDTSSPQGHVISFSFVKI